MRNIFILFVLCSLFLLSSQGIKKVFSVQAEPGQVLSEEAESEEAESEEAESEEVESEEAESEKAESEEADFEETADESASLDSAEKQEETEATAPCSTPECSTADGQPKDGTAGEVQALSQLSCMKSLPEHCHDIKPKFTICDRTAESWWSPATNTLLACGEGLLLGLVDSIHVVFQVIGGLLDFIFDKDARSEAMDVMSFLVEEMRGPYAGELAKDLLLSPILEEVDELVKCLNYRGRFEYFCEAGIQTYAGIKAVKIGGRLKNSIVDAIDRRKLGAKPKLSVQQKWSERRELMSNFGKKVEAENLSPYQSARLTKRKVRNRLGVSGLTDDQAVLWGRKKLHNIPVNEIVKADIGKIAKTLARLSPKQFKAVIDSPSASLMPAHAIEANIARIPARRIAVLTNIGKVPAGKLKIAQIRQLNDRQIKSIMSQQNVHTLPASQRIAFYQRKTELDIRARTLQRQMDLERRQANQDFRAWDRQRIRRNRAMTE